MMGIVYLILCFTTGWIISIYAFPNLIQMTRFSFQKKKISFSPYLLLLPVWYMIGTLTLTWVTYLLAMTFAGSDEPLRIANLISILLAGISFILVYYNKVIKGRDHSKTVAGEMRFQAFEDHGSLRGPLVTDNQRVRKIEIFLIIAVSLLAFLLMWTTFFVRGDRLYIGLTVFSDFSPHIGMIRSFSYGNNFPTSYSHFAGEDIKYHFLFHFLAGNLEYLGLRIDYAFNLPSILSLLSAFLLLYLLTLKITASIGAGLLSCLFFAFRSSKTLFTFLANQPAGKGNFKALIENTEFIKSTPNEDWGLWNLNVYCNQRHLAFGLAMMFFIILLFLARLFEMFEGDTRVKKSGNFGYLKGLFFTKDGWTIQDYRLPIMAGILLGGLSFFHGSAVVGCLLVLFAVAIFSKHRLEFAILEGITVGMSLLQTNFFMNESAVSFQYFFGFLAENKTIFGVASYLERLLGILPFVLLAEFCLLKGAGRPLLIAFTFPLIFAFTVSMTVDVTVNHKYIMMSCALLGIFAADLIIRLLNRGDIIVRSLSVLLIILLTSTGIYDFITVLRKNVPDNAIVLNLEDPLTQWIHRNSDSKDIFLTSNYAINQVVLGGAMLYNGWQYFAWSAGYDTAYRDQMVKQMYEANTVKELYHLVKENNIRFIIIDRDNRISESYDLNEETIHKAYECVYQQGEGEWKLSIYDTQLPRFNTMY